MFNNGFDAVIECVNKVEIAAKELEQLLKEEQKNSNLNLAEDLMNKVVVEDGINKIDVTLQDVEIKVVKDLADDLMNRLNSGIITIKVEDEEKVTIIVKVSDDLTGEYKAGDILKAIIEPFGGRGGGKPTMAQGGYTK